MTTGAKLLIAVVLVAVAAGCGGASSDTSQISSTMTTYLTAVADGNGRTACDQLTAGAAHTVRDAAAGVGATSCIEAMHKWSQSLRSDEKQTLRGAKVVNIHVSGDRATADALGGTQVAQLVKSGSHWLISGGITPPGAAAAEAEGNAARTPGSFDEVRSRLADAGLQPRSTPPPAGGVGALEVPAPHGSTLVIIFFGGRAQGQTYVNDDQALREAVNARRALVLATGDHVYLLAAGANVSKGQQRLFDRAIAVGEGRAR